MHAKMESLIGKKVLVEGDVGAGKTAYLQELILEALDLSDVGVIMVIDMAPSRRKVGKRFVGGRLRIPKRVASRLEYLSPERVFAPRLEGKDERETLELAKANASELEKVLRLARGRKKRMLFINDMTIFLQAGDADLLIDAIKGAETFIGTAYKGKFLTDDKGSGITSRETALLDGIEKHMDLVINL